MQACDDRRQQNAYGALMIPEGPLWPEKSSPKRHRAARLALGPAPRMAPLIDLTDEDVAAAQARVSPFSRAL